MAARFDTQPELESKDIKLRPLTSGDFEPLFAAASDPEVWAGHPAKTRYQREVFQGYFNMLLDLGGALVIIDTATNKIIGCSRYYTAPDQPDSISIGFTFLNNAYWGGTTNFTVKTLMHNHAFKTFTELWFHIDPANIRSQKATSKLGTEYVYDAMLDLSGSGSVTWKCYSLSNTAWDMVVARQP